MALTAHKTVTMFMRYVHAEDDPVRAAADTVARRRQMLIGATQPPLRSLRSNRSSRRRPSPARRSRSRQS